MKKAAGIALLGTLIALGGIWAGAFFMHWLGWGHWAQLPTLITCTLLVCAGVAVAMVALDI